jgi:hypothetical protein
MYAAQSTGMIGVLALLGAMRADPAVWPLGMLAAGLVGLAGARVTQAPRHAQSLYAGAYAEIAAAIVTAFLFEPSRPVQVAVVGAGAAVALYSAWLIHTASPPLVAALRMVASRAPAPVFHWIAAGLLAAEVVLAWTWRYPGRDRAAGGRAHHLDGVRPLRETPARD